MSTTLDLSRVPAADPPAGVTANFENPPNQNYQIYSINLALCFTGTAVLLLRLYTRAVLQKTIALDDWFVIGAQICAWIFAILGIINIDNGYGVHIWDLYLDRIKPFKQNDLAGEDVFVVGIWLVKTSILLFFLRLSPEKRFRQMTYGIMIFVAVYNMISLLVFTLGCIPAQAMWDVTLMPTARCVDQLAFVYANAAFNLFSDLITLALPIRLCWSLQTTFKQKVLLMMVLMMGSFACVIAIVRIVTMMPFVHDSDLTWYKVTLAKWAMVEINVGIICACLPVLRPLLLQIAPHLFGSKISSAGKPRGQGSDGSDPVGARKKVIRNWDYLSTLRSAAVPETQDDVEAMHAMVKHDKNGHAAGIVMSTDYSVTSKRE
ncbi:putative integral membrane protein (Pth11) [Aspergillus saccharolyticus JOP 1030-1]|uniref:Rhodopsin domain-containing protein n=1 Tax=Aspergillus saccharolyticus JOP 1030-1 TaxID=1450539 RepID=A0A318Z9E4_9EURO|nr:hypothetical protein BP01DRAFT_306115 [Aspergillus saccharolyticus JOP 1030-1]PYH41333.1 hypothetical protein BP01DRAFT_306115 [Aspergillus saccharolyticus JOP 1030-1]